MIIRKIIITPAIKSMSKIVINNPTSESAKTLINESLEIKSRYHTKEAKPKAKIPAWIKSFVNMQTHV